MQSFQDLFKIGKVIANVHPLFVEPELDPQLSFIPENFLGKKTFTFKSFDNIWV